MNMFSLYCRWILLTISSVKRSRKSDQTHYLVLIKHVCCGSDNLSGPNCVSGLIFSHLENTGLDETLLPLRSANQSLHLVLFSSSPRPECNSGFHPWKLSISKQESVSVNHPDIVMCRTAKQSGGNVATMFSCTEWTQMEKSMMITLLTRYFTCCSSVVQAETARLLWCVGVRHYC